MFYFLSKTIDFLVMPLTIVFLLLIYAVWTKKALRKRNAVIFATLILFLITNSWLINRAFRWWEPEAKNIQDLDGTYDVGVVLSGGMISWPGRDADHPALGPHADRFFDAYLLYKAGKVRKILITGISSPSWMARKRGETRQAAMLLMRWGVKREDILFEERARNTRENATNTAAILKARFPNASVLLITSAFHMRRSYGCFQKAGIKPSVFPADFYGSASVDHVKDMLVPDPTAMHYLDLLWHEWVGFVVYRLMGYC